MIITSFLEVTLESLIIKLTSDRCFCTYSNPYLSNCYKNDQNVYLNIAKQEMLQAYIYWIVPFFSFSQQANAVFMGKAILTLLCVS